MNERTNESKNKNVFKALKGRNKINALTNNVDKDPHWYAVQVSDTTMMTRGI